MQYFDARLSFGINVSHLCLGYEFNTGVITVMFNIPDAEDDRGSQIHYTVRLVKQYT